MEHPVELIRVQAMVNVGWTSSVYRTVSAPRTLSDRIANIKKLVKPYHAKIEANA